MENKENIDYDLQIIIDKLNFLLNFTKKNLIKIDWNIYKFLDVCFDWQDRISIELHELINNSRLEFLLGLWEILKTNFDCVDIDEEIKKINTIKEIYEKNKI